MICDKNFKNKKNRCDFWHLKPADAFYQKKNKMASSSSTTSSSWASTSSSPDRHLLLENSPSTVQDWPSLSFLEDDLEENAEIIQNTRKFDPVVGARNSTTSTASVRSGSSGFFDALEVSPSSSVSPIVQVCFFCQIK